jgi:hypothetical protein
MTRRKDPQPEAEAEPVMTPADVAAPVAEDPGADDAEIETPPPPPAPPPRPSGPGILGPILGGALAAVGGFGLSHFNLLGLTASDQGVDLAALSTSLDESRASQTAEMNKINAEVAALADRLATLESAPSPEAPDLTRLDALDQRLAAIEAMPSDSTGANPALAAKVADLERRLTELPASGPSADVQKQMDEALARLNAAETAAQTQAAEADAAATAARRAQALEALAAAVTEGRPFAADLAALADPALSSALGPMADTGAPTLAALQADFPDAARAALSLARERSSEDGWSDRLVDFLRPSCPAPTLPCPKAVSPTL